MLKTRVITALALLAILFPVLFLHSFSALLAIGGLFFCAATWENFRLFRVKNLLTATILWTIFCVVFASFCKTKNIDLVFGICVAIWIFT